MEVVADFPEPTSIDRVIASYAEQSGVPLESSPFFRRCIERHEKMTPRLREEMAFLARTFGARWERRGEGYFLSAGKDADEGVIPADSQNDAKNGSVSGTLSAPFGLAIQTMIALAVIVPIALRVGTSRARFNLFRRFPARLRYLRG